MAELKFYNKLDPGGKKKPRYESRKIVLNQT